MRSIRWITPKDILQTLTIYRADFDCLIQLARFAKFGGGEILKTFRKRKSYNINRPTSGGFYLTKRLNRYNLKKGHQILTTINLLFVNLSL